MKSLNLALKTKLHFGWAVMLLFGLIVGGISSYQIFGVTGTVLLSVTFAIIYLLGLIAIYIYLQTAKLRRRVMKIEKAVSDVAGTVGRAAPLIRSINTRLDQLEATSPPQLRRETKGHTNATDTADKTLLHEAAEIVLFRAGLTQSVRASLDHLASGPDVLVITRANWPANATRLGLWAEHRIRAIPPRRISTFACGSCSSNLCHSH